MPSPRKAKVKVWEKTGCLQEENSGAEFGAGGCGKGKLMDPGWLTWPGKGCSGSRGLEGR